MRTSALIRHALSISAAAPLLAGCAGSQLSTTPSAMALSRAVQRNLRPASGDALIYAFTNFAEPQGLIFGYPGGKLVTAFKTPMFSANGACSDAQGDVFLSGSVLQSGNFVPAIEEYTYGSTSPSASVSVGPSAGMAEACSVDGTTGDVAAIIHHSAGGDYVGIFPQFQGPPTIYGTSPIGDPLSVGYDGSGNLFLLGRLTWYKAAFALEELRSSRTGFMSISVNLGNPVPFVTTVQWDGTYVTIKATDKSRNKKSGSWPEAIYRLAISGPRAKVVGTSVFTGPRNNSGPSWIQSNRNIVVVATGHLGIWAYPAGGRERKEIHTGIGRTYVATVAVSGSGAPLRR